MAWRSGLKIITIYSVSLSSGSDVVRLFVKRSAKSCAPREIAHTGSPARKNRECVQALKAASAYLPVADPGGVLWVLQHPGVFEGKKEREERKRGKGEREKGKKKKKK